MSQGTQSTDLLEPGLTQHPGQHPTEGATLAGQVALVTGAGRGLGEAVCRALAEAGAMVLAGDVREDLVRSVTGGICAASGHAAAFPFDVTDDQAAAAAVAHAVDTYGSLDILINNAGVDVTLPLEELPMADFDRILAVNLRGPVLLSRLALPHMRRRGRGHIVNVTSTAAKRAWPNASAYHASKWGLLGFSHALHTEARAFGVKVTAVVSGGMRTPFLFERFPDLDPELLQEPARVAEAIRFVLTQPEGTVIPELTVLPMRETSWP
jgi:NAD(P)-dependent dehydrogenase (short-subunit alcohol dehydrogenase family)